MINTTTVQLQKSDVRNTNFSVEEFPTLIAHEVRVRVELDDLMTEVCLLFSEAQLKKLHSTMSAYFEELDKIQDGEDMIAAVSTEKYVNLGRSLYTEE